MYQVVPERLAQLSAFFPEPPPNAPMLHAFLEGRAAGRAFVDAFHAPRSCVVAMNYNFVFFGGAAAPDFVQRALRLLRREQFLHVVWPGGRLPRAPAPEQAVERIEFRRRVDPEGARLRAAAAKAPPGSRVRRIDDGLFPQCLWRDEVAYAAGSMTAFLNHGIGFCLEEGGAVLAEAYSCFWGLDRAEIATVTHPEHRGRGYAGVACARLIEACEDMGFATYWSCDADNAASLRLAGRLGFTDAREYRLLRYRRSLPVRAI